MHVVHIITGLGRGGAESVLFTLVTELKKEGIDCEVVSLTGPGPVGEDLLAAGVPVHYADFRGWQGFFAPLRLWGLLRRLRPDLVHTWMYHADLFGGLAAWLGRIPVVWHVHNTTLLPGTSRWTTRLIARVCAWISSFVPEKILYCAQAAIPIHQAIGYIPEKGVLVPNGIDTERFQPRPELRERLRQDLNLPPDAFVVAMVARADPVKNHEMLFEAAVSLRSPAMYFVLCGKDIVPENPRFVRFVGDNYIMEHFRFLGERRDVDRLLNACDCAVLCSTAEAFPVVLGEAMATGLPCISTNVGDAAWIIGDTGKIVESGDTRGLVRELLALRAIGQKDIESLRKEARSRIGEYFSCKRCQAQILTIYGSLLDAKKQAFPSR